MNSKNQHGNNDSVYVKLGAGFSSEVLEGYACRNTHWIQDVTSVCFVHVNSPNESARKLMQTYRQHTARKQKGKTKYSR